MEIKNSDETPGLNANKIVEKITNEFRFFNFFWNIFQIFMIQFDRTELELRASFALKSI